MQPPTCPFRMSAICHYLSDDLIHPCEPHSRTKTGGDLSTRLYIYIYIYKQVYIALQMHAAAPQHHPLAAWHCRLHVRQRVRPVPRNAAHRIGEAMDRLHPRARRHRACVVHTRRRGSCACLPRARSGRIKPRAAQQASASSVNLPRRWP